MAKRKPSPSLNPDIVRTVGVVCIFILGIALAAMALAAFLRGVCASSLFTVSSVSIAQNIQPLELPELSKLKGQNLFSVDLSKIEARVRAKYPQLADLRVLRQFPDQVFITGLKRDPFAKVAMDGRLVVIDRDGYVIGAPIEGQEALTVIKGLKRQKASAGDQIQDERMKTGMAVSTFFHQEKKLSSALLEAVNVEDPTRIVCDLGSGEARFQVFIDKDNMAARLRMLSDVLSRGGLDLNQIKYMDLRFGEPIIGQKKVKK
jgi:cell division septal protein FtsQ